MTQRTSFAEATIKVLDCLKDGRTLTVGRLAEETELNRRTVEKVIDMLTKLQPTLEKMKLEVTELPRFKSIALKERAGLLSLPDNIQKLIIRTAYFPAPSREIELLAYLHLKGATSPRTAAHVEKTPTVDKALKQGQIKETEGEKIYLTDEGEMVAVGALDLYPELSHLAYPNLPGLPKGK